MGRKRPHAGPETGPSPATECGETGPAGTGRGLQGGATQKGTRTWIIKVCDEFGNEA